MNPTDTEHLAYVTCPVCRRGIPHPFTRTGLPQGYVHYNPSGPDCRLVVTTDAHGSDHRIRPVPNGQSLEAALTSEMSEAA